MRSIFIGWDPREADAFAVCERSIRRQSTAHARISSINLDDMRGRGLYWRKTLEHHTLRGSSLFDVISSAPMSTEFAISRFLTPRLAGGGWALFMDCDMLIRRDIADLFALADPRFAVMVVKHPTPVASATGFKMDGQIQTSYRCKNWSSVMLFNCDHASNRRLGPLVNTAPGRDLHAFCWLDPSEIGELPPEWNYLIGVSERQTDPAIAHFTLGVPSMPGYGDCQFADEWRSCLG